MGAGNSKPEDKAQLVFPANAPVRFSSELVDSLQSSPQSDTTRSKALELQIQTRVTAELEKLRETESRRLRDLQDAVAAEADNAPSDGPSLAEKLADSLSSADSLAQKQRQRDMNRGLVEKEVANLKKKLETRKRIEAADPAVETAKEAVVKCLRMNDRRPLDCWREVDAFKREVGRLEREFVEKTVR